ncbi:MAG TPA: SCP2 sterol-binding domain-containing protein [Kofleriaceae bacterium]|jgi:putative sterol carrier protein|nr:SCP2 sterol-binding domain-containing protein [Kofleriaceae bacterium]
MAVNLPKDATELFDVLVPQGLKQFPDKAREVNAIYAFKISGEGGGEWTADLTSDPPTIVKGDTGKAQCTIEVAHDDFKTMLSDPNAGMQLYFQGKLRVSGDPMLAMKLQQFFDLARQG